MRLREVLVKEFEDVRALISVEGYKPKKHDALIVEYAAKSGVRNAGVLAKLCGIPAPELSEGVRERLLSDTFSDEFVGSTRKFLKAVVTPVRKGELARSWETVKGCGLLPADKYSVFMRGAKSRCCRRFYKSLFGDTFELDLSIDRVTFLGTITEKGGEAGVLSKMFGGNVFGLDSGDYFYANQKIAKRLGVGDVVEVICTSAVYPDGSVRNISTDVAVLGVSSRKRFVRVSYNRSLVGVR